MATKRARKVTPIKGTEIRKLRTIKLTDSTWESLQELAELIGVSRGDLLEFWMAMLTNNTAHLEKIAKFEGMTVDELMNRLISSMPETVRQNRANHPLNVLKETAEWVAEEQQE